MEVVDPENRDFSLKKDENSLKVFNKCDISNPPKGFDGVVVSALEKRNIGALEEKIYELLSGSGSDALFSAREGTAAWLKKLYGNRLLSRPN